MFRASQRPSSGVPKSVSATSGIGHGIGTATSFHRGLIPNHATVERSNGTNTMTYTRGSRYSFWNSWGWALWHPKCVEFDIAVNKCLRTDASSWSFLLILNHDARNHEFKILVNFKVVINTKFSSPYIEGLLVAPPQSVVFLYILIIWVLT
jgi:hypothetical protein